jgi:DNA-binding transcriptional LysR family regulator
MTDLELRRLDFSLLLIFRAIVRHGRFSAAARELSLTNSAISHAVARLRDLFGDELFLRHPQGVRLTERAQDLAPRIARIIESASELLAPHTGFDPGTADRHIRLGTIEYVALLLGPLLADILEREAPRMALSIFTERRAALIEGVENYGLDLAISSFFGGVGALDAQSLYDDQYVVVARPGNRLLERGLTLDRYVSASHIVVMFESKPPVILESALASLGITRKVALSVPMYLAGLAAAATTDHLLTIHERLALRFAPQFGLEIHPLPFTSIRVTATMVTHPRARDEPGLQWFCGRLRQVAATHFA